MTKVLLTSHQVARRLGIEEKTLRAWRAQGKGPRYIKIGFAKQSPVRYREEDLDAWQLENSYDPLG